MEQLMEGVTVLSQSEVKPEDNIGLAIYLIVMGAVAFIGCVSIFVSNLRKDEECFVAAVGILFLLVIVYGVFLIFHPDESYTVYEVTIDEDVNIAEFCEKYEIVDQKWKIYTIREKEK